MEYVSCGDISNFNLSIVGRADKGERLIKLCCVEDAPDLPAVDFGKTPEETLARFMGMRALLLARGLLNNKYTGGGNRILFL